VVVVNRQSKKLFEAIGSCSTRFWLCCDADAAFACCRVDDGFGLPFFESLKCIACMSQVGNPWPGFKTLDQCRAQCDVGDLLRPQNQANWVAQRINADVKRTGLLARSCS
jgi:hypothetical protein